MIFSTFNSIVSYKDKLAMYNSYVQKVIFIDKKIKEIIENSNKDPECLKKVHESFYNYLVENSFIIDSNVDELALVKEASMKVDNVNDIYILTVNPTLNCNFNCWYCYENHKPIDSKMSDLTMSNLKKYITKIISKKEIKLFQLKFFGGEPLLYFNQVCVPIINHLQKESIRYKKEITVQFTSNGYLVSDKFIEYFKKINLSPELQITLDGYKDNHDKTRFISRKTGSYSTIIKNVRKLLENKILVLLRINYTNDNIKDTYKITNEFVGIDKTILSNYLFVDFQKVWQNENDSNLSKYLDRSLSNFKDSGINVGCGNIPNNIIYSCYADKYNSAVINYNGDVYKCTARDFTKENRVGYLNQDSEITWLNNHQNTRQNVKFKNPPCLKCRILPLCGGGCSQNALELYQKKIDYCIYNNDKEEIDRIIVEKIKQIVDI